MSAEEKIANDVAQFVRRQVREVVVENGPDTFMLSISVWAVESDRTEQWTIYDGFGPEYEAEVAKAV